jgi:hypothetical protein
VQYVLVKLAVGLVKIAVACGDTTPSTYLPFAFAAARSIRDFLVDIEPSKLDSL